MAKATYVHRGENIDYTAAADTEYMEIVLFAVCIGDALTPIAKGEMGTVSLTGVYDMPAAASLKIKTGDAVYWNKTNKNIDTTEAGGIPAGIAVAEKGAAETVVRVKIG